ncbi:MAG: hypothetical protein Q4C70_08110 [Planctomycetia bacterium]|nr:hypothetical protein [Planctomycetia bacterium]
MKKFGISLAFMAILTASAMFAPGVQAQRSAPPRRPQPAPSARPAPPRGHEVIVIDSRHGRPAPSPHHGRPAPPPPPHHGRPAPPPPPHHHHYHHRPTTWGDVIGGIIDAAIHDSYH